MIRVLASYLKHKQNRCTSWDSWQSQTVSCYSLQYWCLSFHLFSN